MNTLKNQRGMSMLSWMAIIAIAIVLGTTAIKLMPVYMEYYSIVSILDNIQKDKSLQGASKQALASTFNKRLNINNVRVLQKGDYKIKKVEGKKAYSIHVKYEVRKSLGFNLSIVAAFDRSVEVGR